MTDRRAGHAGRYARVQRVLVRVLVLNVILALAKIGYGSATGAVSILSDGFHSLADSASNVAALVGVRIASRPPDPTHPYGHRKFETLASAGIFVLLLIVLVQVVRTALAHLRGGAALTIHPDAFALMLVTLAVNLFVVRYESKAAAQLSSEVLLADATHTKSDVFTSLAVIAALVGVLHGLPLLDPVAGLIVAGFIGRAGYEIAKETSLILSDHVVLDEQDIRRVVMEVPGVVGCHEIRTRGSADYVFLDLHLWLPAGLRLDEAHRRSHEAKDRLMTHFPALRDVIIHIEPGPTDRDTA